MPQSCSDKSETGVLIEIKIRKNGYEKSVLLFLYLCGGGLFQRDSVRSILLISCRAWLSAWEMPRLGDWLGYCLFYCAFDDNHDNGVCLSLSCVPRIYVGGVCGWTDIIFKKFAQNGCVFSKYML